MSDDFVQTAADGACQQERVRRAQLRTALLGERLLQAHARTEAVRRQAVQTVPEPSLVPERLVCRVRGGRSLDQARQDAAILALTHGTPVAFRFNGRDYLADPGALAAVVGEEHPPRPLGGGVFEET